MKAVYVLALVGLVAAQNFEGQPDCAIPCLTEAIPKAGCDLADTACQCKESVQTQLAGLAASCLIQNCSPSELGQAQAAAANACKQLASGSQTSTTGAASTGSSSSSASATATGSSPSSATGSASSTAAETSSAVETSSAIETAAPAPTEAPTSASGVIQPSGSVGNTTVTFSKPPVIRTSTREVGGGGATKTGARTTATSLNAAATPAVGLLAAVLAVAAAM